MRCADSLVWTGSILIGVALLAVSALAWSRPRSRVVEILAGGFGAIPRAEEVGFLDRALGFTMEARIIMFRFLFPPFGIVAIALALRVILLYCR